MIRFKDSKPTDIYFSQHSNGASYSWTTLTTSNLLNSRPIIYSALGSHANYLTPGTHLHDEALLDYCDRGPLWDPIQSAYFYQYHPQITSITPLNHPFSPNTTQPTSWFDFRGQWGDQQYPDSDPRQHTVPNFGLKRYVSGPNGPRFKQLTRTGMKAVRGPKPMMLYLVRYYIKLWQMGFRTWMLWVVLGLMLAGLVGCVVCVLRRGKRGGRRWRGISVRRWGRYRRIKDLDGAGDDDDGIGIRDEDGEELSDLIASRDCEDERGGEFRAHRD